MAPGEARLLTDAFAIRLACSGVMAHYPPSVQLEVARRAASVVAAVDASGAPATVNAVSATDQSTHIQIDLYLFVDDDESAAAHVHQLSSPSVVRVHNACTAWCTATP